MANVETASTIFDEARDIARGSMWAYLATSRGGQATVRPVHPIWEGDTLWVATGADSPKVRHVRANPRVELFWHLTDAVRHLTVTGTAACIDAPAEKHRLWDLFDYDLSAYWPDGADSEQYLLLHIQPTRVECSSLVEMGSGIPARVWRA